MTLGPFVRSTSCVVDVVTPEHVRLVFDASTAESALLAVTTHNDMAEACGAFTLTFAPVRLQGRTYDQLIPLRSLVTISLRATTVTGATERVVMVGLTEDHSLSEDFSRGHPQRVVTISGRSMAAVFLDMALRHYPLLEDHIQGTLTIQDQLFNLFIPTNFLEPNLEPTEVLRSVLVYFLGVKSRVPLRQREAVLETQQATRQAAAVHPTPPPPAPPQVQRPKRPPRPKSAAFGLLSQDILSQIRTLSRTQKLILADSMAAWTDANPGASREAFEAQQASAIAQIKARPDVTPAPAPAPAPVVQPPPPPRPVVPPPAPRPPTPSQPSNTLMNLQLPGRTLADLLDLNDDTWRMFDTDIRIDVMSNTPFAVTLWNYLHQFVDRLFQEFFTRVEDGVVKIFFRPKPFVQTEGFTGSRFVDTDPTCRTFTYTQETWNAHYLGGQLRRQTAHVHNAFLVMPLEAGVMRSNPSYHWLFVPYFLSDPQHPSYIAKYGLRELADQSPYISLKKIGASHPTEDQRGEVERIGREWSKIAAAWYGLEPEMYHGVLNVIGNPDLNVGHRLLYTDERGEREFYIEGVDHSYECRTGRYMTQLRVTRGWYLSGLVDERGVTSEEVLRAP